MGKTTKLKFQVEDSSEFQRFAENFHHFPDLFPVVLINDKGRVHQWDLLRDWSKMIEGRRM